MENTNINIAKLIDLINSNVLKACYMVRDFQKNETWDSGSNNPFGIPTIDKDKSEMIFEMDNNGSYWAPMGDDYEKFFSMMENELCLVKIGDKIGEPYDVVDDRTNLISSETKRIIAFSLNY